MSIIDDFKCRQDWKDGGYEFEVVDEDHVLSVQDAFKGLVDHFKSTVSGRQFRGSAAPEKCPIDLETRYCRLLWGSQVVMRDDRMHRVGLMDGIEPRIDIEENQSRVAGDGWFGKSSLPEGQMGDDIMYARVGDRGPDVEAFRVIGDRVSNVKMTRDELNSLYRDKEYLNVGQHATILGMDFAKAESRIASYISDESHTLKYEVDE